MTSVIQVRVQFPPEPSLFILFEHDIHHVQTTSSKNREVCIVKEREEKILRKLKEVERDRTEKYVSLNELSSYFEEYAQTVYVYLNALPSSEFLVEFFRLMKKLYNYDAKNIIFKVS